MYRLPVKGLKYKTRLLANIKGIMKNLLALFLLLGTLALSNAKAQPTTAEKLTNSFNKYLERNFNEKIYIHTDKDNYLAGEIIWFNIYNIKQAKRV